LQRRQQALQRPCVSWLFLAFDPRKPSDSALSPLHIIS
jgi:hypothetical protein